MAIAIEHDAWQAVVLAVDDAIAGGGRGGACTLGQSAASLDGLADLGAEPGLVDGGGSAVVQHLHPDGRGGVPEADGYEGAVVVEHHGQIAGCTLAVHGRDRAIEQPRVATA